MIAEHEGFITLVFIIWWAWLCVKDTSWWRRNVTGVRDE